MGNYALLITGVVGFAISQRFPVEDRLPRMLLQGLHSKRPHNLTNGERRKYVAGSFGCVLGEELLEGRMLVNGLYKPRVDFAPPRTFR